MIAAQGGKKHRLFLILMLGALNTIAPLSIDMYLPGFTQIAHDLHSTSANIAFSVSSYFLGFSGIKPPGLTDRRKGGTGEPVLVECAK